MGSAPRIDIVCQSLVKRLIAEYVVAVPVVTEIPYGGTFQMLHFENSWPFAHVVCITID